MIANFRKLTHAAVIADRLPSFRGWRCLRGLMAAVLVMAALAGCACRPGYIGPYGGVHPGRCVI